MQSSLDSTSSEPAVKVIDMKGETFTFFFAFRKKYSILLSPQNVVFMPTGDLNILFFYA